MNRDDVERTVIFLITVAVVLWGVYGLYKIAGSL